MNQKRNKKFNILNEELDYIKYILKEKSFLETKLKIFKDLLSSKIIAVDENKSNSILYVENFINKKKATSLIEEKTILVIGSGGIGIEMLKHLIGFGFLNFVIFDDDIVKKDNFNRQYIFNSLDIGKYKVDVVSDFFRLKNEKISISRNIKKITNVKDFDINAKFDMIICAADKPFLKLRIACIELSMIKNIPCIFGGVGIKEGTVGPFLKTKKQKKQYLEKLIKLDKKIIGNNTYTASFGPTNSIIAAYMAKEVIFHLLDYGKKSNNNFMTIYFDEEGRQ